MRLGTHRHTGCMHCMGKNGAWQRDSTIEAACESPPVNVVAAEPVALAAAAGQAPVVAVEHAGVAYASRTGVFNALSDVSLDVARGEFISLIGPSGCGKTTLLRLIADLAQPTSGQLRVNGGTPHQGRTDRSYGYVFQSPALYPWRTALSNVMLPLEIITKKPEDAWTHSVWDKAETELK